MALTQIDRELIDNCLQRQPAAWKAFADRFVGLFVHVVRHTAESRSFVVNAADIDEISAEIFTSILADDCRILRHFRGKSSLATYLTVISRRIAVHELVSRGKKQVGSTPLFESSTDEMLGELENRDLIEHLIASLSAQDAQIVRAYHLEGKTYRQISADCGVPENSIGPILSRAREQLRESHSV